MTSKLELKIKKIREYLNKKISQDPYPTHFDGTCAICFQTGTKGWCVLRDCKHIFHGKCILEWYSSRISHGYDPKCPICNKFFFDDEIIVKQNEFKSTDSEQLDFCKIN